MRCPFCNKMTADDSLFCGNCGADVSKVCRGCGCEVEVFFDTEHRICEECHRGEDDQGLQGLELCGHCGHPYEEHPGAGKCTHEGCRCIAFKDWRDADEEEDPYEEPKIINVGGDPGGFTVCE